MCLYFIETYLKSQGHLKVKFKGAEYQGQMKGNQFSVYCNCFCDLHVMRMVHLCLKDILVTYGFLLQNPNCLSSWYQTQNNLSFEVNEVHLCNIPPRNVCVHIWKREICCYWSVYYELEFASFNKFGRKSQRRKTRLEKKVAIAHFKFPACIHVRMLTDCNNSSTLKNHFNLDHWVTSVRLDTGKNFLQNQTI